MIPSYRQGFYDRLMALDELEITVFCQDGISGTRLQSIHERYGNRVQIVPYLMFGADSLVWQRLPLRRILRDFDVVFVDGNPRYLSHFFAANLLRWSNRSVVLWAMIGSFRGESLVSRLRLAWSRRFRYLFLYTDSEAAYLRSIGWSDHRISAMNNGLDQIRIDRASAAWSARQLSDWQRNQGISGRTILLSVGRVEPKNRFELVPAALKALADQVPDLLWVVVGEGSELQSLKEQVDAAGVSHLVHFAGAEYEEDRLAPWFLSARVLVHPGAIGLTLMHAFGYGLPVVTHNDPSGHTPEFAIFREGSSGFSFAPGDERGFHGALMKAMQLLDPERRSMQDYMLHVVRTRYNVDTMAARFREMALAAAQNRVLNPTEITPPDA
jgi:glycosyltransferase involved in cell wall biosynthesis